jgi:hypothetical protein
MKILIIATLSIILATCLKPIHAGELSVSLGQRAMSAGEDIYSVEDWNYIQLTYQPDESNFYYFVSHETAEVAPSYFVWTYTMTGLGIGTRANITKNIRLFGQVGYYIIKNDWGHKKDIYSEGLNYYFNTRFYDLNSTDWHRFTEAKVENNNPIGGTIGIEILQPITKDITAGFSISHRMLRINEEVNVKGTTWWAVSPNRDYSSTNFGVSLNYTF